MANIRKSFNFRNGVQVDDDNFIVNANGLVGIGTSIPSEVLDVYGNIRVSETLISRQINSQNLNVTGISTFNNLNSQTFLKIGITSITSGIISATSGVVTYYGDGGNLLNLPTSQWLDVDVGLGFTSIYSQGNVGVGTIDPRFVFQVGGNNNSSPLLFQSGVGINSLGDIFATGTINSSNFTGIGSLITLIDASNISIGTLNNSRLSSNLNISGIITAQNYFSGTLIGVAATANDITSTSTINIAGSRIGVATITNILHAEGSIGIGTNITNADLHVRKSGTTSIRLTSNGSFPSKIIFGRSATNNDGNAELRFGNTDNSFSFSTEDSLDIINYDNGNFNYYNNVLGGTGNYYWFRGTSTNLMTLTSDGKLGINLDNPQNTLHVVGTSTVTSNSFVGGNFSVAGDVTINGSFNSSSIIVPGSAVFNSTVGIFTGNPLTVYGLQIGTNPLSVGGGVGITRTGNIVVGQNISSKNINITGIATFPTLIVTDNIQLNSAGILTATRFSGDGSTIISLSANNISSGTLNNTRLPSNITLTGNLSATNIIATTNFSGIGSNITNINAENISSGTLNNLRLPNQINISGDIESSSGDISGVNGNFIGTITAAGNISGANISGANISGTNGTFSGNISGAGGNFTGIVTTTQNIFGLNISGSNATFSNNISATNGNFSGNVTATQTVFGDAGNFIGTITAENISGNNGSFSNNVSGDTGNFSGIVTASSFSTGNANISFSITGSTLTITNNDNGESVDLTLT